MADVVEKLKKIGNNLFHEKDYSSALKYYKNGLSYDSSHPQLNVNASITLYYLGLFDESEKYALRAIASKSDYEKAYYRAIKAAEKKYDFEKQLEYLVQAMQNCKSSVLLLEEAHRIQHLVVVSSFCQDARVEEFFSQPRTAHRFIQLEKLMERAKKESSDSAFGPPCGHKKPTDLFPEFSGMPNFFGNANSGTGVTINMSGPFAVHGENSDNSTGHFIQVNESSKLKEDVLKNAAKPKTPAPTPQPQTPPPKAASAKENVAFSFEGGKFVSRSANKSEPSDQRGGKKPRADTCGTGTTIEVNTKETKSGTSITEEIISTLKKGRESFINSFYHLAVTYLVKAQAQLEEHSLENVAEFAQCKVPLAYVICEAKVGCGEYKDIVEGIQMLRKLIEEEMSRNFPAVFYLLGLAFYKLNRFKEAREHLEKVNARIKGGVNFTSYPWPGTFDVINSTQKIYLETVVKDLLRECSAYHKPNWICLFEECEKISTHIIPCRKIYFNDPDFSGYVELTCCAKCSLIFHRHCWKAYKEKQEIKRLTDKAVLGEPCLTPDCVTSIIVSIKIFDKDGKITHHDSIPYEAPAPKSAVTRSKLTDSSTVQKEVGVSKGALKAKQKSQGSLSSPKTPRVGKRAGEEGSSPGVEEKEIDFEAELEIRKRKLDNIRTSDKRWQQFNIDTPDTSQLELTEEEKFVDSFFEEVLKNSGPLHVSQVEDYFRDNKTVLENAVPSLRSLYHLLRFLLERSHHFVLMDSVLGLAADLVDMYRTTKDIISIRLKSSSKDSLDLCLNDMKVTSAANDSVVDEALITGAKIDTDLGAMLEADIRAIPRANTQINFGSRNEAILKASLEANTAADSFVPYKKTVFGPEVEKTQPIAPRTYYEALKRSYDSKFDPSPAELDFRPSPKVPVPLQLGAFIKPKNPRVKEKKNADVKSATREKNCQVIANDKRVLGKGKKNDAQVCVNHFYNSGVLSILLEKTVKKDVPVTDEETSGISSASSEKSSSVMKNEAEFSQVDEDPTTTNPSDVALPSYKPDCEKDEWNSDSSETSSEPKQNLVKPAVNRVLIEKDQLLSAGTPSQKRTSSFEPSVNGVLNKKDLLSSAGTPPETKARSVEPAFNCVLNEKDQLLSAGTPSETPSSVCKSVLNLVLDAQEQPSSAGTPSENEPDSVADCVLNEKDQLSNNAIAKTSSEGPVLQSVKSFIQAAFRNSQHKSMIALFGAEPRSSSTGSVGDDSNPDPSKSTQTSGAETVTSGSYRSTATSILVSNSGQDETSEFVEAGPEMREHLSSVSSFNSACDRVGSADDFVSDNVSSSPPTRLGLSCEKPVNLATPLEDTEKCGNLNLSPQISIDTREGSSTLPPSSDVPGKLILFDISDLPVVDPGSEEQPFSPVIKDLPPEDTLLFEECPEDLFIIDDKKYCPISNTSSDVFLNLPLIDDLDWDLEDIPEDGDLFVIEPSKEVPQKFDDLFEVSGPNEVSSVDLFKTNVVEKQQGDGMEIENNNIYKRWQPTQAEWDYIRLSFPRQNYSRLIEGIAIIYDKKGPEISKMSSEEIVKELAKIFQLTPCLQYSDEGDGGGSPDNVPQETQSAEISKETEDLNYKVTPWKPPVPLVQVVRLSFPTEEFYKLMFALYLAKLYSDTTKFDDLCDGVANILNDINEGKCHDYNYEISTHGPYNDESRIIYEKAWQMLIDSRSGTGDV